MMKRSVFAIVEMPEGWNPTSRLIDVSPVRINSGIRCQTWFRKRRREAESAIIRQGYRFLPAAGQSFQVADPLLGHRPLPVTCHETSGIAATQPDRVSEITPTFVSCDTKISAPPATRSAAELSHLR